MNKILILDCGGQYTHLIKKILLDSGYESYILPADIRFDNAKVNKLGFCGVIISGGMGTVSEQDFDFDSRWIESGFPVLGICYGHQLLAHTLGGKVEQANKEFGIQKLKVKKENSLIRLGDYKVWASHNQSVTELPDKAVSLASSGRDSNSIVKYSKDIYGVQFHPEVTHSSEVEAVIYNFARTVCRAEKMVSWCAKRWLQRNGGIFSERYKNKKIVLGLSGGVDSMTLASFVRRFHPKSGLFAIYVDNGLNPTVTLSEVKEFCIKYDINLEVLNEKARFLDSLEGVEEPPLKGSIIGRVFIECFEEYATKIGSDYLAQGTIWSDVIESGVTKFSSVIKPHHNVGGLPKKMNLELVEPFRELFKDQVRSIAKELGLEKAVVEKKVFPGPGFAIRIDGAITEKKLDKIRCATKIVDTAISHSSISSKIWMAFPVLVNAKSLGIRGDKRYWNNEVIVLRAVESKNSMTVNFSEAIFPCLGDISTRLTEELDIGRVVYDITNKPPGTIEWQ